MKTFTALTALLVGLTLARPNILPQDQQELIQPSLINLEPGLHFQSTLRDVLLANQIIPQVLDDFEPTYYVKLSYPKSHEEVLLGNDIPVKGTSKRPIFTFHSLIEPVPDTGHDHEKNSTFTLILTDPDALSRDHPVKSEMCHWIITNLTTPLSKYGELAWPVPVLHDNEQAVYEEELYLESDFFAVRKSGEIESYMPPAPPKKTGPHRYVFVLLEGDTSQATPPKKRAHWGYGKERHGVRDWAAENDLKIVGVNFFYAQHKKQ